MEVLQAVDMEKEFSIFFEKNAVDVFGGFCRMRGSSKRVDWSESDG